MTQEQQVYDYIKNHGSITTMDAFIDLRITRLSAQIFNLKEELKVEDKERIVDEWEYGENGKKWKRYKIMENENDKKNTTITD